MAWDDSEAPDVRTIRFDERVALVTGAARGLGRSYALELARRGARVVVNDYGGAGDGTGADTAPAQAVVDEIVAAGGAAYADSTDITDREQTRVMVDRIGHQFGRLDIVINNAGILRDRTFVKKDLDDFAAVVDVHLWGSVNVVHAAWPLLLDAGYGRILLTTSISGTLGSFGQADYAAAKAAMFGLMSTLALEGARRDVRVNAISPAAATRMTQGLLDDAAVRALAPERVVPAALYLVSDAAPTGVAIQAGAGSFSRVLFAQSGNVDLPDASIEDFAAAFEKIADTTALMPVRVPEPVDRPKER